MADKIKKSEPTPSSRPAADEKESCIKHLITKPIVLVGMMGAGKSSIGVRLARQLDIDFVDADTEIEKAARMTIEEIFANHGEAFFRDRESRVIARLLKKGPCVLATGGGAFNNPETRRLIKSKALSIWLSVPVEELVRRVKRKPEKRPLLADADIKDTLTRLLAERAAAYGEADITIDSKSHDHDEVVLKIIYQLETALGLDNNAKFA